MLFDRCDEANGTEIHSMANCISTDAHSVPLVLQAIVIHLVVVACKVFQTDSSPDDMRVVLDSAALLSLIDQSRTIGKKMIMADAFLGCRG